MTAERTPGRFELSDLATNRILFALALLGVALPLNSIVSHYLQVGFTYQYTHQWLFWKPFHLRMHAVTFFYSMEALLAIAVYFYGFNLIFRRRFLEYMGTGLFTVALLVPLFYLYLGSYSLLLDRTSKLGTVESIIATIVGNLLWLLLFLGGSVAIFRRLERQDAPATTETGNDPAVKLQKLQELLNANLLTQEEYKAKRAEVINSI
jgi:hypothetical protein